MSSRATHPVLAAAIAAVVASAGAPLAPGPLSGLMAPAAEAKSGTKPGIKSKAKRSKQRPLRATFPGVVAPNPGLNFPNPNRPAYNSGTVAPLAVPRQDPIVPGGGYVPQVRPTGKGPETYQDRVSRCTHQSGLGGLSGGQSGVYIHNCSM